MREDRFNEGDIFAVPLPTGEFIFGKIQLDVARLRRSRKLPPDSNLLALGNPVLVEMYRAVSPSSRYAPSQVLIPGAFLQTNEFGKKWKVVDHIEVDVPNVAFPESLIGHMHDEGSADFICGEIRIPLPISHAAYEDIDVCSTAHSTYYWPAVCMQELGRAEELPEEIRNMEQLSRQDLRFSEHRRYIYKLLPIDTDQSYYEQQAQLGYDIERLYI
jgi:hypothetical protein